MAGGPAVVLHPCDPAFCHPDRIQAGHAGRLHPRALRPLQQDRFHGRTRAGPRHFFGRQGAGAGRNSSAIGLHHLQRVHRRLCGRAHDQRRDCRWSSARSRSSPSASSDRASPMVSSLAGRNFGAGAAVGHRNCRGRVLQSLVSPEPGWPLAPVARPCRGASAVGSGTATAYQLGAASRSTALGKSVGGVAAIGKTGAVAAFSPLRRAISDGAQSGARGGLCRNRRTHGGVAPCPPRPIDGPPDWARRMKRQPIPSTRPLDGRPCHPLRRSWRRLARSSASPKGPPDVPTTQCPIWLPRPNQGHPLPEGRPGLVRAHRLGPAFRPAKLAPHGDGLPRPVWPGLMRVPRPGNPDAQQRRSLTWSKSTISVAAQAVAPALGRISPDRSTDRLASRPLRRACPEVPAGPIVLSPNWLRAYDFATDRGAVRAKRPCPVVNDPFAQVGDTQISIGGLGCHFAPSTRAFRRRLDRAGATENGQLVHNLNAGPPS